MNLNALAGAAVAVVNPKVTATLRRSTGNVRNQDGSSTPTFAPDEQIEVQVQPMTTGDIQRMDGLGLQGIKRKLYANTQLEGQNRNTQQGGDLIVLPDGFTYLVVEVMESWPAWSCAAVTEQNTAG